ncbi:MAG: DUF447 domain-containing protein [Methanoculleaceae archaeon]
MGLLRPGINEVIATTRWNAAPIGIICRDPPPKMVLFYGSDTARNIEDDGWVVANFIYDPVVYVEAAFSDLPRIAFREAEIDGITVHRLAGAEAWIAFRAEISHRGRETMTVNLTPIHEEIDEIYLHPVNRGFSGIIEATVHATRYIRKPDPWLMRLIEHHARLIRKCGGPREHEALDLLMGYLDEYREDHVE